MKIVLTILVPLIFSLCVRGQDVHLSQFHMNPVYLNPALTGNFEGDWRFTGNQRSQWRSVSRPYNTFALSAENREELLLPGLFYSINLVHDAAGDGDLRTTEVNLSAAYKSYLDSDSLHSFTPGLQFGLNHRNINFEQLNFDEQFNGFYYDPTIPVSETFNTSKRTGFNFSFGGIYTYKPEKRKELVAGISLFNIPRVRQTFFQDNSVKRDRRLVIHARGLYELNFEWDLQPAILMQFQGKYKEIIFGSNIRYILTDKKGEYLAPYGGLWLRNRDAVFLQVGAYYNSWIFGISYDINLSKLVPASKVRGGLEFSVQYILKLFKPKNIQHRICPDYL